MLNLIFSIDLQSFLFGALLTLFLLILFRKQKKDGLVNDTICEDSRFYLNVFFLNRKEIVENIVRSKVKRSRVLMRALTKRLAVNMVTDEKLISKVGADLKGTIPQKLELQGVKATATVVHQQGCFICIEVNIYAFDFLKMAEVSGGPEKAAKIRSFLESFGIPGVINFISNILVRVASKKVMKALPTTIIQKLQDKLTADVEVLCLNDAEQGPFLCQTLQQLNAQSEEAANEGKK